MKPQPQLPDRALKRLDTRDVGQNPMTYSQVEPIESFRYFTQFKKGDEVGLSHIYNRFYKSLLRHGKFIVNDEFVVYTAIQEAFLKVWEFRQRLTSPLHTYRFLRLNVTWKCYDYYRQPNKLQYHIIYTDDIGQYVKPYLEVQDDSKQISELTEEKLQAIYNVIPYLPANRKTIFTLYYKYGLSFKQIASRFASNRQAISHELRLGLEQLRRIIHSKKRLDTAQKELDNKGHSYPECLQGEQLHLFRLRYEMKWSFEAIAWKMNLPVGYVQQQYIAAHRLLRQTNNLK